MINGYHHPDGGGRLSAATLTPASSIDDVRTVLRRIDNGDALAAEATLRQIKANTGFPLSLLRQTLRALRQTAGAVQQRPAWTSDIILTSKGEPAGIAANVETALRGDPAWQGCLGYDEFRHRPMMLSAPPWAKADWTGPQPFSDADEARTLVWIQRQGIHVHMDAARQALAIVSDDHRYHPVRDYLDSLIWDEVPRLDDWLTFYLGAQDIPDYTSPVGVRWMISAVARIFEPGCMAKYALILEGPQDLKKSAALEVLGDPWYTDDMDELGSKDSKLQVGNAWIIELAELDSLKRAHINTIKAFISRKVDRFRKPFGRYIVEQPRQCVLAGTVNPSSEYFGDDTGAVRFWPIVCVSIDLEALRADKDQLWAEAVSMYRRGVKWWLDADVMINAAAVEQEARYSADSWEQNIRHWLQANPTIARVTIADILTGVFEIPASDHDRIKQTRVGIALRRLNWCRPKQVRGEDGRRGRWYEPPAAA